MVNNQAMANTLAKGVVAASTLALALCVCQSTAAYAAAVDEQEPNDSFETANVIKMNQTVYGTLPDCHDYDYYKVTLPANGSVKVSVANDVRASNYIYAYMYDSQLAELNSGYTVIQKNNETLGTANASISLKRGVNYIRFGTGTDKGVPYHFKLTYVIGGTNVTKLTPAKKSFSTSWVKKSGAASYQVRYTPKDTYKLYGWDQAVKTTVSKSSGSAKVSGLKSKTPYYVQVRVAQTIDGETYYSSWTGKKTVTTK